MHTTCSFPWRLPAILMAASLIAGCGITTKTTFLGEPVLPNAGNTVPVSSGTSEPGEYETLEPNAALNKAEATGVQKMLNIITPYRVNIQQGNFISKEMLSRVQPGMTQEQVRFALGTPLLTDIFHADRWDYVFRLQKPNGQVTHNRVVVYFEDKRVARVLNDPLPDEIQYIETLAGPVVQKPGEGKRKKAQEKAQETAKTPEQAEPPLETDTAQPEPVTEPEKESYTPAPRTAEPEPVETAPVNPPEESYTPEPRTYEPEPEPEPVYPQETVPEPEPVRTVRPKAQPVKAAVPAQPAKAVTVQDQDMEPEEDFRAAPNSAMQLHDLMQPN